MDQLIKTFEELASLNGIPIFQRFTSERKFRHYFKRESPIFFETRAFCSWICTVNNGAHDAVNFYLMNPSRSGRLEILQRRDCIYTIDWFLVFQMSYRKSEEPFSTNRSGEQIHAAPGENSRVVMLDDLKTAQPLPIFCNLLPSCAILETSQGNFQHFYISDLPLEANQRFHIQKTLAKEFGGDPGATGGQQMHRIPGSVNYKSGKNLFVTRLVLTNLHGERLNSRLILDPSSTSISCRPTLAVLKNQNGGNGDTDTSPSGRDWHHSIKMKVQGWSSDEIYTFLHASAKGRGKRDPAGYARITLDKLFNGTR